MNTIRYEDTDQEWEDDGFEDELPARPRRRFLSWWSAALMALILGGVGFYAGVRVEKNQVSGSAGAGVAVSAAAGRSGTGAASFASRFGGGRFGGAGGPAGGGASVGTVSSVDGNTIYVTDTSGNTIKVKLSSATTIRKTENVPKAKVFPGDTVVVSGVKGSGGTLTATTLTDSGSRGGSTTGGGGGSSAISSLFGGG